MWRNALNTAVVRRCAPAPCTRVYVALQMMVKTLAWALSDILLQIASKEGGTGNVKIACVHGEGHVDDFDQLHAQMRFKTVTERVELEHSLLSIMNQLQGSYGVVLFMYSCVATRGPDVVREDMGMDVEPLISMPFGHASLSLVNLLLAGISTPHVHDGVQDVGVPLKGIDVQTQIGYLTVLESLRYITVGTLLKGPSTSNYVTWVVRAPYVLYGVKYIGLVSLETKGEWC